MRLLNSILFISLLLISYQVMAKGPQGVMYTKHNLANWNTAADTFRSSNVNEVCVFCHTPHGAGLRLYGIGRRVRGEIAVGYCSRYILLPIHRHINIIHYLSSWGMRRCFV